jgi:DNA polymerase elongation subunit (family B)
MTSKILVPYSVIPHADEGEDPQLYFWCLEHGQPPGSEVALLRVHNTPIFAFIELPETVSGRRVAWDAGKAALVVKAINKHARVIERFTFCMMTPLYYYQREQDKAPHIVIFVYREANFYTIEELFRNSLDVPPLGLARLSLLEARNIPLATKLLTTLGMDYSQYFRVECQEVDSLERVTTARKAPAGEWRCRWNEIKPIPLSETTSWTTHHKIMTVDGEMHSSNENRFPVSCFASDALWMWSVTCQYVGIPESRHSYLVVIGPPPDLDDGHPDNEEVARYHKPIVYCCRDEYEVRARICQIIDEECPVLITGWNVYFDWGYLDARFGINMEPWPRCSRLPQQDIKMVSMKWESAAYSRNEITYPAMEGIIFHDMMTQVRRDEQLVRYSLGFVAQHFLGRGKVDISYKSLFRVKNMVDSIEWDWQRGANEAELARAGPSGGGVSDSREQVLVGQDAIEGDQGVPSSTDVTGTIQQGEARRRQQQLGVIRDKATLRNNLLLYFLDQGNAAIVEELGLEIPDTVAVDDDQARAKARVDALLRDPERTVSFVHSQYSLACRYGFFDTILPLYLFERLNTWIGMKELSNIVKIPIDQLSTRGQQIRVLSQLYQQCRHRGIVIKKREVSFVKCAGGAVMPPRPGLYSNLVVLDFASLYPMIIIWLNLCYTTLIRPDQEHLFTPDQYDVYEWVDEAGNTHRHCIIKKEIKEGILPRMVRELVDQRRATRAQIALSSDPVIKKVLNSRQLGLKVSANSVYGFLGTKEKGKLPCNEISETVTFAGRSAIAKCNDYVAANYGDQGVYTVYGDTDSTMIHVPGDLAHVYRTGKKLEKETTALFQRPMEMEFENIYAEFFILCKKHYAGFKVSSKPVLDADGNKVLGEDGQPLMTHTVLDSKEDMVRKGIITAKRTECHWMHNLYDDVLYAILKRRGISEVLNIILEGLLRLKSHSVSYEELIMTKGYSGAFKADNYVMAVFGRLMAEKGTPLKAGERLDLVYVKPQVLTSHLQGYRLRTIPDYLEKRDLEPIDPDYYIEHSAMKPLDQLVSVAYPEQIAEASARYPGKHNKVLKTWYTDSPVKQFVKLFAAKEEVFRQIRHYRVEHYVNGKFINVGEPGTVDQAYHISEWRRQAIETRRQYLVEVGTCRLEGSLPERRKQVLAATRSS